MFSRAVIRSLHQHKTKWSTIASLGQGTAIMRGKQIDHTPRVQQQLGLKGDQTMLH